jgi:Family of unknown function (DUF6223)
LAIASGGPNSGNGVVGAAAAVVLGLIATVLGGLTLSARAAPPDPARHQVVTAGDRCQLQQCYRSTVDVAVTPDLSGSAPARYISLNGLEWASNQRLSVIFGVLLLFAPVSEMSGLAQRMRFRAGATGVEAYPTAVSREQHLQAKRDYHGPGRGCLR